MIEPRHQPHPEVVERRVRDQDGRADGQRGTAAFEAQHRRHELRQPVVDARGDGELTDGIQPGG